MKLIHLINDEEPKAIWFSNSPHKQNPRVQLSGVFNERIDIFTAKTINHGLKCGYFFLSHPRAVDKVLQFL